jgi:rhamnosyltransferase
MLDQDSEFDRADIQTMKTNIKHCMRNKVGLHAPMICYRGSQADRGLGEEPREWVIASGSFLNLRIVRQFLLRFDENYFIDKFEVDFCKQLRLKGCEIILYRNCMLRQKLGYPGKYVSSNHNPVRHYYLFRNRLYFNQKFHSGLVRMGLDILQSGRHLASIIIREDCKIQKLRMCMKGYGDYLRGSLGCVESVPGDVESGQV